MRTRRLRRVLYWLLVVLVSLVLVAALVLSLERRDAGEIDVGRPDLRTSVANTTMR